ncbi:MAG: Tad domain-containing protein, partial [Pseudomonadota bacterium]
MKKYSRALQAHLGRFSGNTDGNIAMMSGVIALPFMTMLALAVDVNYASNHRDAVQSSLDSALLAAAREGIEGGATEAEMEAELTNYFNALIAANGSKVVCQAPDIDPVMVGGVITADVECYSPTIMAGLIGKKQIDYDLNSEVNFGIGKIDVAFVFDVSGSMDDPVSDTGTVTSCDNGSTNCDQVEAQSRMEALQDAAKAGVEKLLTVNGTDRDDVRIAMVSYNQAVNAGVYFESVTGMSAERTYYFGNPNSGTTEGEGEVVVIEEGNAHNHLYAAFYDTRDNSFVAELRDNMVLQIPEDLAEHLTISVEIKSTSNKYGKDESMQLRLQTDSGFEYNHLYAAFYDTRDNSFVAELRDNMVLQIPEDLAEHLTISVEIKSTSNKYGKDESMQLRLQTDSGFEYYRTENYHPYTLNGDSNGNFFTGVEIPTDEWVALRMRTYKGDNLSGNRITNKTFDFRLDIEDGGDGEVPSITITDTCTYERNNGSHWNKTTAPGAGKYLTADEATYDEDSQSWTVPAGCSSAMPLALTADKAELDAYINALPTGGGTAGHLG